MSPYGLPRGILIEFPSSRADTADSGAAASIREWLEETLTVQRLGLMGALLRTLHTANVIDLMGSVENYKRRVKRWRGGQMIQRRVAPPQRVRRGGVALPAGEGYRDLRWSAPWTRGPARRRGLLT